MPEMDRILVVAAHPDDEVLGCGGVIAKHAIKGNDVFVIILGEGVTSRDKQRDRNKREKDLQGLKTQINDAANILGAKETFVFDFPDNRFDTVPLLDIVKTIESIKSRVNPNVLFTHHHGDLNIDHQLTFKAVMTATRPIKDDKINEIYSFEVLSSTEWNSQTANNVFLPNCFFAFDDKCLDKKIDAMKCYTDEIRDCPHPRSSEIIESLAKYRGSNCGYEYAEAFQAVRIIKKI